MTKPISSFFDPSSSERWDAEIDLPNARSNRPITFGNKVEAAAVKALFGLFRLLGPDASSNFMGKTLRMIGPLLKPVQKRGMANLDLVYPLMPKEQKHALLKSAWENLGRIFAEFACLEKIATADRMTIEDDGVEKLQTLFSGERPIIFVGMHHANWEVMCPALFRSGIKHGFIYRPSNNPIIDDIIINTRASVMSRYQMPKGKLGGRQMVAALKKRIAVCTMVDQKLNSGGIPSPFLGHEAMTAPAPARMALKFNALIVPLALRRGHGARFTMTVHDPVEFEPTGNLDEDVSSYTDKINEIVGEIVLENPGQWLWFHKRWPKEIYPR